MAAEGQTQGLNLDDQPCHCCRVPGPSENTPCAVDLLLGNLRTHSASF